MEDDRDQNLRSTSNLHCSRFEGYCCTLPTFSSIFCFSFFLTLDLNRAAAAAAADGEGGRVRVRCSFRSSLILSFVESFMHTIQSLSREIFSSLNWTRSRRNEAKRMMNSEKGLFPLSVA